MTVVYRIQDHEGRGPYRPGFSDCWVDPDNDGSNCPNEFPYKELKELTDTASEKGFQGFGNFGFGFRTLDQLNRWFTVTERAKLTLLGYQVVVIEVDVIIAETPNQVLFCRRSKLNAP